MRGNCLREALRLNGTRSHQGKIKPGGIRPAFWVGSAAFTLTSERMFGMLARGRLLLVIGFLVVLSVVATGPGYAQETAAEQQPGDSRVDTMVRVFNHLVNDYYVDLNPDELLRKAIDGMLSAAVDPYTVYYDLGEYEAFKSKLEGNYGGIGVVIVPGEKGPEVVKIFAGAPAEAAGLRPGDIIQKVDGQDVTDLSVEAVADLIRGEEGTPVTLFVSREGRVLEITITRADIRMTSAHYKMLDGTVKIGYIAIETFREGSGEEFRQALATLEHHGLRGLILDLRGNPGGFLGESLKVAASLVPAGPLVSVQDRNGITNSYVGFGDGVAYPLAVLVDGSTASAAEIVAGAVQDRGAGVLIGETTYGKALVQSVFDLPLGGLKLTSATYITPLGRMIHGKGLDPDIVVSPVQSDQWPGPIATGMRVREGMRDGQVAELQKRLQLVGLFNGRVDGFFGPGTREAVSALQALTDLKVTGLVDERTLNHLNEYMSRFRGRVEPDAPLERALLLLQGKLAR